MIGEKFSRILGKVKGLTECRNVKFSRPPITAETNAHTPSKYSVGGLRHHGEWIGTFCEIQKAFKAENTDFGVFLSTKTGKSFVKALEDRVFSLKASEIYEILLTLSLHKTRIESLEAALVRELEDSMEELHTFQLLDLPGIINKMNEQFSEKLKQVTLFYTRRYCCIGWYPADTAVTQYLDNTDCRLFAAEFMVVPNPRNHMCIIEY